MGLDLVVKLLIMAPNNKIANLTYKDKLASFPNKILSIVINVLVALMQTQISLITVPKIAGVVRPKDYRKGRVHLEIDSLLVPIITITYSCLVIMVSI